MSFQPDERSREERLAEIPGGRARWLYLAFICIASTLATAGLVVAGATGNGELNICFAFALFSAIVAVLTGTLAWKTRVLASRRNLPSRSYEARDRIKLSDPLNATMIVLGIFFLAFNAFVIARDDAAGTPAGPIVSSVVILLCVPSAVYQRGRRGD